ncbi:MAG: site-2 protease family protein [Gemmataceae bacterium]
MRSWKLGRAFGIGLFVHWTFLLVPALVLFLGRHNGLESAVLDVGVVLAVFGCVLLHELGHALAARGFGIGTRDITLYPIGGVARLERMSDHPGEEVVIAVAGPLVNVVIAAGLWFGLRLFHLAPSTDALLYGSLGEQFVMKLLASNILLVAFNLIPAFPMDGGRVLRALLAIGFGQLRATQMAVGVAKVFALLFFVGALLMGAPTLALIAFMLPFAGRQELAMVEARHYHGYGRDEVLTARPLPEPYATARPADPDFTGFTFDRATNTWVQWHRGRPTGACSVGEYR